MKKVLWNTLEPGKRGTYETKRLHVLTLGQIKWWRVNLMALFYEEGVFIPSGFSNDV